MCACLQATLHEVWRIEIHSRLCADVHSFLGQSVGLDLPIKGDRYVRRVACFASHHAAVSFEQGGKLKIPAGACTDISKSKRPISRLHLCEPLDRRPTPLYAALLSCHRWTDRAAGTLSPHHGGPGEDPHPRHRHRHQGAGRFCLCV